jgi:hypothetical protein
MPHSLQFRTQTFAANSKQRKLAALICGYGGKIEQFKPAIVALNVAGYDVEAYEYDTAVLSRGRPEDYIELVGIITKDVAVKAHNVQRRLPQVKFGLYTSAGVPLSQCVFHALPFRLVRRQFKKNGYDEEQLAAVWQEIDVLRNKPPVTDTPFVVVVGRRDKIVCYTIATNTLRHWQAEGVTLHILTKRFLGHRGTIAWFKHNIPEMLTIAQSLPTEH